jgi:hypothetical protein
MEWAIVRYIFRVIYEKIVFDIMNNESVRVNGSNSLIS